MKIERSFWIKEFTKAHYLVLLNKLRRVDNLATYSEMFYSMKDLWKRCPVLIFHLQKEMLVLGYVHYMHKHSSNYMLILFIRLHFLKW